MFIHTNHDHDTFWVTVTTEENGMSGSTVTLRLSAEDATHLCSQIAHELEDWRMTNDPHEQAALLDEYQEERREIEVDLAYANEPF
jgi:hypothetical protein